MYISSMHILILQDNAIIEKLIVSSEIDIRALQEFCVANNIAISETD
jgi:hypothetical protein